MSKNIGIYKKSRIALAMVLFFTVFFSGCGDNSFFARLDDNGKEYQISNQIYLPMEKVRTLNPAISKDEDTYGISKLVYDGLFELDENLMPQGKLVDSYVYDEDKLSLSLSLKHGVKWHDGKPFTAADVKFSIEAYMSLAYSRESIYSDYVSGIKSVSVGKNDQYHVTITFRSQNNMALENLIFPILPAHQFKNTGDIKKNIEQFVPVGTGAYQVESYNNLSRLVLEPNRDYFHDVPQNILEFVILPKKSDALNLVDVGNISILYNKDSDRDTLINNMNVESVNFISSEAEFIGFNFKSNAMKNVKLRQAIAHAVNTEEIIDRAYLKSGVPSNTIYHPNYFGKASQTDAFAYDLDAAISLIKQSGYRDQNDDGYVDQANGEDLEIVILVNDDNPSRAIAAQIIKNGLDKLPLYTYIKYCSWNEYVSAIGSGDYDLYIGGYVFNERYDLRNVLHTAYGNPIGYSNPDLDELLDEMQSGVSNQRKSELFEEVQSILTSELPYYCILYKTYGAITSNALEGEVNPLFHDFYNGCETWMCRYEQQPAAVAE